MQIFKAGRHMKKIAFVTGGFSGEAIVSYESAKTIYANLDRQKYEVYKVDITPQGWWYVPDEGERIAINKSDFTFVRRAEKIRFDGVFIGIHGTPGEDGKLQGYFDMLGLPYQTCDATTSALTFNKRYTVAVAALSGIKVAQSLHLFAGDTYDTSAIVADLGLPLFVKPNNGGSSIGMSKVTAAEQLADAITKAFAEDNQVLIEQFIKGREFTIGVFRSKGQIITLPMTEIIPKTAFFDFEAKYTPGLTDEITPADAPDDQAQKVAETARRVYQVFNCRGAVRIDFIYNTDDDAPYMLEINTVPGQTQNSLVPQQVRASGRTLLYFYTMLIEEMFPRS